MWKELTNNKNNVILQLVPRFQQLEMTNYNVQQENLS